MNSDEKTRHGQSEAPADKGVEMNSGCVKSRIRQEREAMVSHARLSVHHASTLEPLIRGGAKLSSIQLMSVCSLT